MPLDSTALVPVQLPALGSWRFDLDFLVIPAKAQRAAAEKPASSDCEVKDEKEEEEEGSMDIKRT